MQHDAAHELCVEVALLQGAFGGFAHGGESIHQNVIQRLAGLDAALEPLGARGDASVIQSGNLGFLGVHRVDDGTQRFDQSVVARPENAFGESAEHSNLKRPGKRSAKAAAGRAGEPTCWLGRRN